MISSPIITFLVILIIPSTLTFITLLIHRLRAARAAQRDRAPEDVVHRLPWCVWTGTGWEKHEGPIPEEASHSTSSHGHVDLELGEAPSRHASPALPSVPDEDSDPEWFSLQAECAICLEGFVKGDRVRVLPCKHVFHLNEVDAWLINRKKLASVPYFGS